MRFAQSQFGRDAGIADGGGGRGSRAAFGSRDDYQVGFRLCHTGGNGAHAAFRHQLHADFGARVHVLQVEDELCQVFDGVDVVVGRGRNQRDARDGVACPGYHFVHLETGKLSAFTGLGALGYLDLYFVRVHQILCRDAETSRSHLLDGAAQAGAVFAWREACPVFATFTGIAASVQPVHGNRHRLVCLLADGAVGHGARDKTAHDAFHRFHPVDGDGVAAEVQEVAQEDRRFFAIHQGCELLELLVASQTCGKLQGTDGFRVPGMLLAILTESVQPGILHL